MAAGIIDGRNVWKSSLQKKAALIETLSNIVSKDRLILQPSNSLLHVPVTAKNEQDVDTMVKDTLAFTDEKLAEIILLTKYFNGEISLNELIDYDRSVQTLNDSPLRNAKPVQDALNNLSQFPSVRVEVAKRQKLHD